MWGPKARGWVTDMAAAYHGLLFNEVHEMDLCKAIRHLRKAKFLADGAKATATDRERDFGLLIPPWHSGRSRACVDLGAVARALG